MSNELSKSTQADNITDKNNSFNRTAQPARHLDNKIHASHSHDNSKNKQPMYIQ